MVHASLLPERAILILGMQGHCLKRQAQRARCMDSRLQRWRDANFCWLFKKHWFLVNANVDILTNYTRILRRPKLSSVCCPTISVQPLLHIWLLQCFPMAQTPLKSAPSCGEICTPSNTWFLGPTRVTNPNGISIGSAVLDGLTNVFNRPTDWQTDRLTDRLTTLLRVLQ